MPDLSVADNLHRRPAAPLGADLPPGPEAGRRGAAGAGRLRGRQSARAGQEPAAVAPADGRDRQGARPKPASSDPRRGHLRADQCRRRQGLCDPAPASRRGLAILYISHRMHEIDALADTCSVFRNGRHVETFRKGDHVADEIVQLMIGREWAHVYPPKPAREARPEPVLEVTGLSWAGRLKDISLSVGAGEIVGLGGLDGQGQRELLLAFFGVLRGLEGESASTARPSRSAARRRPRADASAWRSSRRIARPRA